MSDRSPTQALAGRARGIVIGALIAFGWAAFGASFVRMPGRVVMLAIAAVPAGALLAAGIAMLRQARAMPAPTPSQRSAGRRAWRWFWLNLVGEIVLLNIAVNLLAAPDRRIYWIPAISAVVGLHFWPMAVFFRVRSYWAVGAAMMVGAAIAALSLAAHPTSAAAIVESEALANATVLGLALAAGAVFALRRPHATPAR